MQKVELTITILTGGSLILVALFEVLGLIVRWKDRRFVRGEYSNGTLVWIAWSVAWLIAQLY